MQHVQNSYHFLINVKYSDWHCSEHYQFCICICKDLIRTSAAICGPTQRHITMDSFFLLAQQAPPPVGYDLIHEVSRSHKTRHHSR